MVQPVEDPDEDPVPFGVLFGAEPPGPLGLPAYGERGVGVSGGPGIIWSCCNIIASR